MQELSLYILDIANNCIRANARNIDISIAASSAEDLLTITIADDGCGMSQEMVDKLTDPYTTTRTTRNVGMGVSLYNQLCCCCGGGIKVTSAVGVGTTIVGNMKLSSIDLLPLGDIVSTMTTLITSNIDIDYTFALSVDDNMYQFDTKTIKAVLEGVPIDTPEVMQFIKEQLTDNTEQLQEEYYEVTQRARGY